jgi:RNA polymerase sigma-70 factor (ECF subfamily)
VQHEDDTALVARIRTGDRAAFGALVERYATRSYRVAYRLLLQRQDAEDVVQECLLKFWQEPWRWDASGGGSFATWFYRVVSNAALNRLKRRRFEVADETFLLSVADEADTHRTLEEKESRQQVASALRSLPESQQQAVGLCFYEGFSNQEAAAVMAISVTALQSLLMRAKNALKQKMEMRSI